MEPSFPCRGANPRFAVAQRVAPKGMLVSLGLVASVCGDARLQRMLYLAHVNRAVNPRVHLLLVADNLAPSSSNIDPGAVFDPEPAAVAAYMG